jgi:hypothetical protein
MTPHSFTEEDKEKFVEFLNHVAKSAQFTFNTKQVIDYFKLLSHMQQVILPKITNNILEIKKVTKPESEEKGE